MSTPFIATPMYGGVCHGTYTGSMIKLALALVSAGIAFQYSAMINEALLTQARDRLAADFLATDCTHLLFIDADIGFRAEDVLGMLAADKPVLCGLYPKKEIDWERVAQAVKDGVEPADLPRHAGVFPFNTAGDPDALAAGEPVQILDAGAGFMLIRRDVLADLAAQAPEYATDKGPCRRLFDLGVDPAAGGRLLTEDFYFCQQARAHGHTVWAAPWAKLTHSGWHEFSGDPAIPGACARNRLPIPP